MGFRFILGYIAICLTSFDTFAAGGKSTGPSSIPVPSLAYYVYRWRCYTGHERDTYPTLWNHILHHILRQDAAAMEQPSEHHVVYCQGGEQKTSLMLSGTADTQHLGVDGDTTTWIHGTQNDYLVFTDDD